MWSCDVSLGIFFIRIIHRRLAWSLRKDDMYITRNGSFFLEITNLFLVRSNMQHLTLEICSLPIIPIKSPSVKYQHSNLSYLYIHLYIFLKEGNVSLVHYYTSHHMPDWKWAELTLDWSVLRLGMQVNTQWCFMGQLNNYDGILS